MLGVLGTILSSVPVIALGSYTSLTIEMPSLARLGSEFEGAAIIEDRLICSCGKEMALRPAKDPKCKTLFFLLGMEALT